MSHTIDGPKPEDHLAPGGPRQQMNGHSVMQGQASISDQPSQEADVRGVGTGGVPTEIMRPLEALQRAVSLAEARVVAIASPRDGDEAGRIAELLAGAQAASDVRTLLIEADASGIDAGACRDAHGDNERFWEPGQPLPEGAIQQSASKRGFDRFYLRTSAHSRPLFNNLDLLRRALSDNLGKYDAIIIELPALLEGDAEKVNPVSVARAADAVFLLCKTGVTQARDARRAADLLIKSNVEIAGTLLDTENATRPGREIAERLERWRFLPRGFRSWLGDIFRRSAFFND